MSMLLRGGDLPHMVKESKDVDELEGGGICNIEAKEFKRV